MGSPEIAKRRPEANDMGWADYSRVRLLGRPMAAMRQATIHAKTPCSEHRVGEGRTSRWSAPLTVLLAALPRFTACPRTDRAASLTGCPRASWRYGCWGSPFPSTGNCSEDQPWSVPNSRVYGVTWPWSLATLVRPTMYRRRRLLGPMPTPCSDGPWALGLGLWVLGRFDSPEGRACLPERLTDESDAAVLEEIVGCRLRR